MATQKSTQAAPDKAIEDLLEEIASTAYLTEQRLRLTPADIPELHEYELDLLRDVVKKMGWLADIALQRIGSGSVIHGGDAVTWLLPPLYAEHLAIEVQS